MASPQLPRTWDEALNDASGGTGGDMRAVLSLPGGRVRVSLVHDGGPSDVDDEAGGWAPMVVDVDLPTDPAAAFHILSALPPALHMCPGGSAVNLYALMAVEGSSEDARLELLEWGRHELVLFVLYHAMTERAVTLYFEFTDPGSASAAAAEGEAGGGAIAGHVSHADAGPATPAWTLAIPSGGRPHRGGEDDGTSGRGVASTTATPSPTRHDLPGRRRLAYQRGPILFSQPGIQMQLCVSIATSQLLMRRQLTRLRGESREAWQVRVAAQEREFKLLRSYRHPGMVKCVGRDTKDANVYRLLLEYLPGGTLRQLVLRFGPMRETMVRRYARTIAHVLADCHARGLVHNAVSADHMLLTGGGGVKLAGWGNAFTLSAATADWRSMAAATKLDVFYLGLMVYEVLTGVMCDWRTVFPCPDEVVWRLTRAAEANIRSPRPAGSREGVHGGRSGAGAEDGGMGGGGGGAMMSLPLPTRPLWSSTPSPLSSRAPSAGATVPSGRMGVAISSAAHSLAHATATGVTTPTPTAAAAAMVTIPSLYCGCSASELAAYAPPSVAFPAYGSISQHGLGSLDQGLMDPAAGHAEGRTAAKTPTTRAHGAGTGRGSGTGEPGVGVGGQGAIPPRPPHAPTTSSAGGIWSVFAAWMWGQAAPTSKASGGEGSEYPSHSAMSHIASSAVSSSAPPTEHRAGRGEREGSGSGSGSGTTPATLDSSSRGGGGEWDLCPSLADMVDAHPLIRRLYPDRSRVFPPHQVWNPTVLATVTPSDLPAYLDLLATAMPQLPPLPADVSHLARSFISDCTRLNPMERPSMAEVLAHHPFLQLDEWDELGSGWGAGEACSGGGGAPTPSGSSGVHGADGFRRLLAIAKRRAEMEASAMGDEMEGEGGAPAARPGWTDYMPAFRLVANEVTSHAPGALAAHGLLTSTSVDGLHFMRSTSVASAHRGMNEVGNAPTRNVARFPGSSSSMGGHSGGLDDSADFTVTSTASHLHVWDDPNRQLPTTMGSIDYGAAPAASEAHLSSMMSSHSEATTSSRVIGSAIHTVGVGGGEAGPRAGGSGKAGMLTAVIAGTNEVITLPRGFNYEMLVQRKRWPGKEAGAAFSRATHGTSSPTSVMDGGVVQPSPSVAMRNPPGSGGGTHAATASLPPNVQIQVKGMWNDGSTMDEVSPGTMGPYAATPSSTAAGPAAPLSSRTRRDGEGGGDVEAVTGVADAAGLHLSGAVPQHPGPADTAHAMADARTKWRKPGHLGDGTPHIVYEKTPSMAEASMVADAFMLHDPVMDHVRARGNRQAEEKMAARRNLGKDAAGLTREQNAFLVASARGGGGRPIMAELWNWAWAKGKERGGANVTGAPR